MVSLYGDCPLTQKDHNIRVLRLRPSAVESAQLECEIFGSYLGSDRKPHPYEALSYVWGSPADTVSLRLNGHRFEVTANLHAALLHLRNPFIDRYLWIDALCINQKDDGEKEQQIQHMYEIYGNATRVLVWLGVADDTSDQVFEDIRAAAQRQGAYSLTDVRQRAVFHLLGRPWFQRIWVR
jgi:hypothetical protein